MGYVDEVLELVSKKNAESARILTGCNRGS